MKTLSEVQAEANRTGNSQFFEGQWVRPDYEMIGKKIVLNSRQLGYGMGKYCGD